MRTDSRSHTRSKLWFETSLFLLAVLCAATVLGTCGGGGGDAPGDGDSGGVTQKATTGGARVVVEITEYPLGTPGTRNIDYTDPSGYCLITRGPGGTTFGVIVGPADFGIGTSDEYDRYFDLSTTDDVVYAGAGTYEGSGDVGFMTGWDCTLVVDEGEHSGNYTCSCTDLKDYLCRTGLSKVVGTFECYGDYENR